jgi:hypothetical protein
LSQRLIAGEVVWVFLAAGPEEKSNELKAILTQELDRRQDEDPSPEAAGDTDPASGSAGATGMPCSTLWLDRGDPEEAWLIANLLAMEPDLASDEFGDLNLVFPLYGRGRILTALMGNGVNPAILRQTVQVLRAPCQNESKAANPGLDLLLSVDWAERLAARPPDRLAAGAAFGQGAGASAVDPTLPGGPLEAAAGISKSGRAWRERSDGAEPMERGAAEAAITADVGEIQIPAADLPDVRDEVNRPGGKVDPLERPAPAAESGPVTWLPWSILGVLALFAVVVAVWVWRWY